MNRHIRQAAVLLTALLMTASMAAFAVVATGVAFPVAVLGADSIRIIE